MITIILFILIGIKLNMMNGLYLGLIITYCILWFITSFVKIVKKTIEFVERSDK